MSDPKNPYDWTPFIPSFHVPLANRVPILVPMSTDKYPTIVTEYENGATIYTLADAYNVTPQTMHALLKVRGCVFRPRGRRKNP